LGKIAKKGKQRRLGHWGEAKRGEQIYKREIWGRKKKGLHGGFQIQKSTVKGLSGESEGELLLPHGEATNAGKTKRWAAGSHEVGKGGGGKKVSTVGGGTKIKCLIGAKEQKNGKYRRRAVLRRKGGGRTIADLLEQATS